MAFNPRRAWGVFGHPSGFWHTCSYILFAHISDLGHSRSGHQFTSSGLTSEKVWMLVIATPIGRSPRNFQRLISVTVSRKCIARNFDIDDLRSGQVCDLFIMLVGEKWKTPLLEKTIRNSLSNIELQADLTHWAGILQPLTSDPLSGR